MPADDDDTLACPRCDRSVPTGSLNALVAHLGIRHHVYDPMAAVVEIRKHNAGGLPE